MEEIEARNTHLKKDYKTPLKEILSASSIAYLLSPFRSKRFLIKIIWSLFEEPYFKCENNNSCYEKFNKIFKQTEMCSQLCPLECDQYSYEIFHTPSKIIGTGQINKFKENDFTYISLPQFKTYENVSKTYYSINAYYEDSKYTLISQQPRIELFGLISNLGGILGLFIGFSFISLLEIIELLAEFIYIYLE